MGKPVSAAFGCTVENAVDAFASEIAAKGWQLQNVDKVGGLIAFKTGMTLLTWSKQMSIQFAPAQNGVTVTISGGAQFQITDWGETAKTARQLITSVQQWLGPATMLS